MPFSALDPDAELAISDTYRQDTCGLPCAADATRKSMRSLLQSFGHPSRPSPPPALSPESEKHFVLSFANFFSGESFFSHSISPRDTVFDLVALLLVAGLLLLSFLSFAFIFHLQLRSRHSRHLQNFNSLWTVRSLLVLLVSLWAVNELLGIPLLRINHFHPFLPSLTVEQQEDVCKLYIVLSLGLIEPSFFIILFFLLHVSIKETNPRRRWSLVSLFIFGFPIMVLQIVSVYFSPWEMNLPEFMHRSFILSSDHFGNKTVLCTYPFFSWLIFCAFAVLYSLGFLVSCWRVMAFVINKGIAHRIYFLATTVMVALPMQILCLCLSEMWIPGDMEFGCLELVMFLCVAWCMAVAEILLVLKPIKDALEAAVHFCRQNPGSDGGVDVDVDVAEDVRRGIP